MGLFNRFQKKEVHVPSHGTPHGTRSILGFMAKEFEEPEIQLQICAMTIFISTIAFFRLLTSRRLNAPNGKRVLDLSALNDASMCKEIFLAYLNAALLEPVLAIGGMEEAMGQELVINIITLGSICSWIWLITDAFDYTDVCQSFKYQ